MRSFSSFSWLVLLVAILSWAGVGYFYVWIQDSAREKGRLAVSAEEQAANAAHFTRMQTLAKDTAPDRARLETLLSTDIVRIAERIEQAGEDMGVRATVGAVLPGSAKEIDGGPALRTASFVIQAEGTFSGLVRLAKVLEKFPAFSSIEQFELERIAATGTSPWRATIRLKVKTTSQISL
jgi:hypothetical protein